MSETERNLPKSFLAFFAGFLSVAVLSLATDQILHVLKIYPPWGQPMESAGLLSLALAYRCVYTIFGAWLTARLAPRNPWRHVLVLGIVGFIMSLLGMGAALAHPELGPRWYPIALVVTTIPCIWLGGVLHRR